jgi:hypothetical protein
MIKLSRKTNEIMGIHPIVQMGTTIEEVSKLFTGKMQQF